MDDIDIHNVLKIMLDSLNGKDFSWRLEGSANLKVQGVETPVRDLDITTDEKGLDIFRKALRSYVIQDFHNDKINAESLVCDIMGFEVEINQYNRARLSMLDGVEIISWRGFEIPVLPLAKAREFYSLIGRQDKVDLIDSYLK